MVTGEFAAYRTYDTDLQSQALARRLCEYEGVDSISTDDQGRRVYIELYADCITLTQSLIFDWHEDTPDDIQGLEQLWNMVIGMRTPEECFAFFKERIGNHILYGRTASRSLPDGVAGWRQALYEALVVWTPPPEWKLEAELTPEEAADPFSGNAASKSE